MEFGKRHDTTDTTDFCPRQLVTDLLRGNLYNGFWPLPIFVTTMSSERIATDTALRIVMRTECGHVCEGFLSSTWTVNSRAVYSREDPGFVFLGEGASPAPKAQEWRFMKVGYGEGCPLPLCPSH